MPAKLLFHYDVVSPWAYVALQIVKRYVKPWQIELVLKPVYLGGIMVTAKNQPPLVVPNKGKHMNKCDLPLTTSYYGIPYRFPPNFPINTIHIVRFLRVVEEKEGQAKLAAVTDIFYNAIWGLESDPNAAIKPENFQKLIPSSVLSSAKVEEYLTLSAGAENKDRIKDEAAALVRDGGAFGAPWIVAEKEDGKQMNFFGSDRFELIAYFLGKKWEGPWPQGSSPPSQQAKL